MIDRIAKLFSAVAFLIWIVVGLFAALRGEGVTLASGCSMFLLAIYVVRYYERDAKTIHVSWLSIVPRVRGVFGQREEPRA